MDDERLKLFITLLALLPAFVGGDRVVAQSSNSVVSDFVASPPCGFGDSLVVGDASLACRAVATPPSVKSTARAHRAVSKTTRAAPLRAAPLFASGYVRRYQREPTLIMKMTDSPTLFGLSSLAAGTGGGPAAGGMGRIE